MFILQALSTLEMMISGFSGLVRDPRDSSHHRHIVFSILRTITVSLCESYTKPEEWRRTNLQIFLLGTTETQSQMMEVVSTKNKL